MNGSNHDWQTAYIGLGSNIGDREAMLAGAIRLLEEHSLIRVAALSPIYETEPVGYLEQPAFLNMAARLETGLPPEKLLAYMLETELHLERKREIRWGPRTIDIDLLLYGDTVLETPDLTLPHPRMLERAFVLVPLSDVLPGGTHPVVGSIEDRLDTLEGKEGVKRWKDKL